MYYVEFLRVFRALRGLAYVLGGFIVLTLILLPWSRGNHQKYPDAAAGTTKTQNLSDGTTIRDYTDVMGRQVHLVQAPSGITTVRITDFREHPPKNNVRAHIAGRVSISVVGGRRAVVTEISEDPHIALGILLIISSCVATLMAAIFGLALSRENDGHLELAWTKPASRERYALSAMVTDAAGILIAGAAVLVTIFIIFAIQGEAQYVKAYADTLPSLAFSLIFPLSVYAMVSAATSSLRRGAQVLAIFMPVALLSPLLSGVSWMSVGTVARVINTINPVAYFYSFVGGLNYGLLPAQTSYQLLVPLGLAIAGVAASLAQWRRMEA